MRNRFFVLLGLLAVLGFVLPAPVFAASFVAISTPTSSSIRSLDCTSATACVGVGTNNTIVRTTDGTTWSTVASPLTTSTVILRSVDLYSSSFGLAVGDNGSIIKTTDGGATWTSIPSATIGSTVTLYDVSVPSATTAYIAAGDADFYVTTDSGVTWTNLSGSTVVDPRAIATSSTNGMFVGGTAGYLYKSSNAATSSPTFTSITTGTSNTINAIAIPSSTIAFIGGTNRYLAKVTYSSSSATVNSQILPDFGATESVTDIACNSTLNCYVTGSLGHVEVTLDGGSTWNVANVAVGYTPHSVAYFTTSVVYLGSETGSILKMDDVSPTMPGSLAITSGHTTTDNTPSFTWTASTDTTSAINTYKMVIDSGTAVDMGNTTSGTWLTALADGSHVVYVYAVDGASNNSALANLSFVVDTAPPVFSDTITPTTATAGSAVTLAISVSDATSNLGTCSLYINASNVGTLSYNESSAKYQLSYTFSATGSYTAYASCTDAANNTANSSSSTIVVSAASSTDTTAPSVSGLTPTTATQNSATTFSTSYSDAVGVTSCSLYVNSSNVGGMSLSGSVASLSYTPVSSGSYSMYVQCSDAAGNVGTGSTATVTVSASSSSSSSSSSDSTAPSVSGISPTTAIQKSTTTFSTGYTDTVGVTSCTLYVDGNSVGNMSLNSGTASLSYTPTSENAITVYAQCQDAAGNVGTGSSATISITIPATSYSSAAPGSLVKMACADGADVNDPCKAVYYLDTTAGKRHAFPNEPVYFSWYSDFDDVITVTDSYMSSLTLGKNVTYHPGYKLVKFVTVNTVYAVGTSGELRGIDSETTASAIYGTTWNKQVDDISDAFHGNYIFGTDITSSADYNAASVYASVNKIDSILQ